MSPLKQARHAVLPALALIAWGAAAWGETRHGVDFDRDDLIPASLAVVLSVWALLDYYYAKFWRESRKVKFEHALESVAAGVSAYMRQQQDGDGHVAGRPQPKGS
jgi:hypothetical protein